MSAHNGITFTMGEIELLSAKDAEIETLRTLLAAHTETIREKDAEIARLEAALRDIATRGIYDEGEMPMTPSELREIARAALEKSRECR